MGKPTHCCPKHQFPLDRKGEQCPVCREEIEDELCTSRKKWTDEEIDELFDNANSLIVQHGNT